MKSVEHHQLSIHSAVCLRQSLPNPRFFSPPCLCARVLRRAHQTAGVCHLRAPSLSVTSAVFLISTSKCPFVPVSSVTLNISALCSVMSSCIKDYCAPLFTVLLKACSCLESRMTSFSFSPKSIHQVYSYAQERQGTRGPLFRLTVG